MLGAQAQVMVQEIDHRQVRVRTVGTERSRVRHLVDVDYGRGLPSRGT